MSVRVAMVLVSHSKALAEGLAELAGQMAPNVHIHPAGGMDDASLGTSYDLIEAALEEASEAAGVGEGAGVVLLTDLGSATMTTESVLDFADEPERFLLVDAPLVEGAVAAAVSAQMGEDVHAVAGAARAAAAAWGATEGGGAEPAAPEVVIEALPSIGDEHWCEGSAVVADPVGLHARPAAELARLAASFDADVLVDGVDATSVLELMSLGVRQGDRIHVRASGPQAEEALAALLALVEKER